MGHRTKVWIDDNSYVYSSELKNYYKNDISICPYKYCLSYIIDEIPVHKNDYIIVKFNDNVVDDLKLAIVRRIDCYNNQVYLLLQCFISRVSFEGYYQMIAFKVGRDELLRNISNELDEQATE